MTKQILDLGTNANDGTGDTLRSGGTKINDNFTELYTILGGASRNDTTGMLFDSNGVIYSDGTYQTKLEFHEHEDSNTTVHMPHHSGDLIVIETGHGGHHGADRYIDLKDSDSGSAARVLFGNAYDSAGELPSSSTYHGMFAFVHDEGVAVVAPTPLLIRILYSPFTSPLSKLTLRAIALLKITRDAESEIVPSESIV